MLGKRILPATGCAFLCLLAAWAGGDDRACASDSAEAIQEEFIRVAREVMPSVVSLKTERMVAVQPFGLPPDLIKPIPALETDQGSGFVIDSRGYILTNAHIVAGAQKILVRLSDSREVSGKVVGMNKKFDIALVKVPVSGLKPVVLGDSSKIQVGQWAIAIGSPFGLEHTMTVGIVSATGRSGLSGATYGDFIQTSASVNPGNSGGPLLDIEGRVIGMTSMFVAEAQGIGFALPVNTIKAIISSGANE